MQYFQYSVLCGYTTSEPTIKKPSPNKALTPCCIQSVLSSGTVYRRSRTLALTKTLSSPSVEIRGRADRSRLPETTKEVIKMWPPKTKNFFY